jgi:hypothetical protein
LRIDAAVVGDEADAAAAGAGTAGVGADRDIVVNARGDTACRAAEQAFGNEDAGTEESAADLIAVQLESAAARAAR